MEAAEMVRYRAFGASANQMPRCADDERLEFTYLFNNGLRQSLTHDLAVTDGVMRRPGVYCEDVPGGGRRVEERQKPRSGTL